MAKRERVWKYRACCGVATRERDAVPLVLDSPHSGSVYPEEFAYRCPLPMLRRAEDAYVDELYGRRRRMARH